MTHSAIVSPGISGAWASQQMAAAVGAGQSISPAILRTCDTLRRDEWKNFDDVLVDEARVRLEGVSDLVGAGLSKPIPNAFGKTIHQYEKVSDMDPAIVSLDGEARGDNDRVLFANASVPLPVTHKDFDLSLRHLAASRERGESLDTTQARVSGRKVAEKLEEMLFIGGNTFGGFPIYGYTDHPDRNTASFGAGTWSASARTGAEIFTDAQTLVQAAIDDNFYGPYWLYVSMNMATKLAEDYRANDNRTIAQRLLDIDQIQMVKPVSKLTADNVVLVQATSDVVEWGDGEPIQTIQWDFPGGMRVGFKAFSIQVPLVKSTKAGASGIVHMS